MWIEGGGVGCSLIRKMPTQTSDEFPGLLRSLKEGVYKTLVWKGQGKVSFQLP